MILENNSFFLFYLHSPKGQALLQHHCTINPGPRLTQLILAVLLFGVWMTGQQSMFKMVYF